MPGLLKAQVEFQQMAIGQSFLVPVATPFLVSVNTGFMHAPLTTTADYWLFRLGPVHYIDNPSQFGPAQLRILDLVRPVAFTTPATPSAQFSANPYTTVPINESLMPGATYVFMMSAHNGGYSWGNDISSGTDRIPNGQVMWCTIAMRPSFGELCQPQADLILYNWPETTDILDFSLTFAPTPHPPITTAPEPASLLLTASGLGIIGMMGYRRRKAS